MKTKDRVRALCSYQEGTFVPKASRPSSSSFNTYRVGAGGAPGLQSLTNVTERYTPQALRSMTSLGSLGHMFVGSDAGPTGNPFAVGGGPSPAPAPAPAPRVDALAPSLGASRIPTPRAPLGAPSPAPAPQTYKGYNLFDPQGFRIGSSESRARYMHPAAGGPSAAVGSSPEQMQTFYDWLSASGNPTFREGSLGYEEGSLFDQALKRTGGDVSRLMGLVNRARSSGDTSAPELSGYGPDELAILQRIGAPVVQGQEGDVEGILFDTLMNTGWDTVKNYGTIPLPVVGKGLELLGVPGAQVMRPSPNQSKPSLKNLLANIEGAYRGLTIAGPGLESKASSVTKALASPRRFGQAQP